MLVLLRSRLLIVYVTIASALITTISILQYNKYSLFGTNLLLGWDSPLYVWISQDIITKGPFHALSLRQYPYLYNQLLAFLGYLTGNITLIERILPLIFGTLLIYANAKITHKITKNIHIAGLAAILTSLSLNTLRLLADLNRNLMALSLSFTSFLLIADFTNQTTITKKTLRSKTYLTLITLFLIIAATQFETFFILALTTILLAISTRNPKKLTTLTLLPTIPTAVLLALFPQLPNRYLRQIALFTRELAPNEILLWTGGSWLLLTFLTAGTAYITYKAVKHKDTLATTIFAYTAVITMIVTLATQKILTINIEYTLRALLILPTPILLASTTHASATLLRNVFIEIGVTSPTKRHAIKISIKHITLITTVLILLTSSATITYQHYDQFLTPYIPKAGYEKIATATQYLNRNGITKPIVLFYGEHANWFSSLYNNYIGAQIGDHYYYQGDINNLLRFTTTGSQYLRTPILIITPHLYDKEIPYFITPYHIGQGIYIIPPNSNISNTINYGPTVTVTTDHDIKEIKSEYLYADQDDPSVIVLRVAAKGYTSYTFENYPQDWTFLKLEQGNALSYPERSPQRFNGTNAIEGNDPTESTQNWSTSQTATISLSNSTNKEGAANLRIDGTTDSWGNLGARYNPAGTWNLSSQSTVAVWARANTKTTFSIALTDSTGNTRTYWDIQQNDVSATTQWKRFTINLNDYTSQPPSFDLSRTDSIDFYVYSTPGKNMSLWIDDPVTDKAPSTDRTVYKARVLQNDPIIAYFAIKTD